MNSYRLRKPCALLITLLTMYGCLMLTACVSTVDDYFTQTATQRLQHTIGQTAEVLQSAEYGWELDYYPGSELQYGGVVYIIKFAEQQASVQCSLIPDSTATSYYKLTNDNGPVLSFDTYNPLMHYYATPSSSEYEAKGGDFEFVISSVTDTLITLYGKKTHNSMTLRRLKHAVDDYAHQTVDIFDHFVDSVSYTDGSYTVKGKYNPTNKSLMFNINGVTATVPFAFTNTGIRLYHPLTTDDGLSLQTFRYDRQTSSLTCTDPGAEQVVMQGIPYKADFMHFSRYEGSYNFTWESGSVPVTLVPNRLEGTYLMKGLSPMYDLVLRYVPETGDLTLGSQVIGNVDGNEYYWVAYDFTGGFLSIADEAQFTIRWNKNRFYPAFNFSATNPNVLNCDGGVLIYLYYTEDGTLTAGIVDNPEWLTSGTMQFRGIKSLNRTTRME